MSEMTPRERARQWCQQIEVAAQKATQVVGWYAHRGGDSHGPEATVRGPFMRWLKCTEVRPEYAHRVADPYDDVEYAAAAMNGAPAIAAEFTALEAELADKEDQIVALQKELDEQARVNGTGGSRELKLMTQVTALSEAVSRLDAALLARDVQLAEARKTIKFYADRDDESETAHTFLNAHRETGKK